MGCSGSKATSTNSDATTKPPAAIAEPDQERASSSSEARSTMVEMQVVDADDDVPQKSEQIRQPARADGKKTFEDMLRIPDMQPIIDSNLIGRKMMQDLFEIIDKDADGLLTGLEQEELLDMVKLTFKSRGGTLGEDDDRSPLDSPLNSHSTAPSTRPPAAALAAAAAAKVQYRNSLRLSGDATDEVRAQNQTGGEIQPTDPETVTATLAAPSNSPNMYRPNGPDRQRPKVKKFLTHRHSVNVTQSTATATSASTATVTDFDHPDEDPQSKTTTPNAIAAAAAAATAGGAGGTGTGGMTKHGFPKDPTWRYSTGNVLTPFMLKSAMPDVDSRSQETSARDDSPARLNPRTPPQQKKGFLMKHTDGDEVSSPCLKRFFTLDSGALSYMDSTSKKPPFSMTHRVLKLQGAHIRVDNSTVIVEPRSAKYDENDDVAAATSAATAASDANDLNSEINNIASTGTVDPTRITVKSIRNNAKVATPIVGESLAIELVDEEEREKWITALQNHIQYSDGFTYQGRTVTAADGSQHGAGVDRGDAGGGKDGGAVGSTILFSASSESNVHTPYAKQQRLDCP